MRKHNFFQRYHPFVMSQKGTNVIDASDTHISDKTSSRVLTLPAETSLQPALLVFHKARDFMLHVEV